jgi:hypothetical protein
MANIYTFSISYSGRTEVWLEAENEAEARERASLGDWDDSADQTWESEPAYAQLISVKPLTPGKSLQ